MHRYTDGSGTVAATAILIDTIATDLERARVCGTIRIIAITTAKGASAGCTDHRHRAVAIVVVVVVAAFIERAVAIVVLVIARFRGSGVAAGAVVITIIPAGNGRASQPCGRAEGAAHEMITINVQFRRRHSPIAIVIHTVAHFRCAGMNARMRVIAIGRNTEAITIGIRFEHRAERQCLVHVHIARGGGGTRTGTGPLFENEAR